MAIQPIKNPQALSDGDGISRSRVLEAEWLTIDAMGTARNSLGAIVEFGGTKIPLLVAKVIPFFQVIGGLLLIQSTVQVTLPASTKSFVAACKSQEQKGQKEGIFATGLGLANQFLCLIIGGGLTAAGVTEFLGPVGAHIFHYTPILGQGVSAVISDLGLGIACVARGTVMVTRSLYNLSYIIPFHNHLKKCDVETAFEFLKTELQKGKERFIRRMGKDAAEAFEFSQTTTDVDEKIRLIQLVDKGIFKQKLMQYLTLIIGILMIAGGVAAIIFSGGTASLAIPLILGISCILFAQMESLWLFYDSTPLFNGFIDKLYRFFPLELHIKEQSIVEEQAAS